MKIIGMESILCTSHVNKPFLIVKLEVQSTLSKQKPDFHNLKIYLCVPKN